ncbi:MAG: gamma-glutamyltransferase family protein [Gemmataceae bacterium]
MAARDSFTTRPLYLGRRGLIAAGHYLAARAGQRMFDRGGNAIDAAVAAGFALNLLMPHVNGLGGEVPILVYSAAEKKVFSISGQGFIGRAATLEQFRKLDIKLIPGDGFLPATVPAAFGSWAFALQRFGTRTLREALEPTIELATHGYPLYAGLRSSLTGLVKRFQSEWPSSAALYLVEGKVPPVGHLLKNPDTASLLEKAVAAERASKGDRAAGIQAAIDFWYRDEPARRLVEFLSKHLCRDASGRSHRGLLTRDDFAAWKPTLEPPVSVEYRGLTVYKCGPWTQGPVFLQQLRLLEGFDLARLGHNSPGYIHTVTEAAKLAFADREKYYGDPAHAKIPLERLLSAPYAAERRGLIDPRKASLELRPGDAARSPAEGMGQLLDLPDDGEVYDHDTTHTCAIDAQGNMMAATCSGGWIPSSPVVPGVGFSMGTRGQMFDLDAHRPNVLAPRKRPRTTLTPTLALRDGRPYLAFGTPGGDQQDQWTLQFFLNVVDHGMNLMQAIDAASFHTTHFPSSFYPRKATAGGLVVESRIPAETRQALEALGHKVTTTGDWSNGMVMAVQAGPVPGTLAAGVSPRGETGYVSGE